MKKTELCKEFQIRAKMSGFELQSAPPTSLFDYVAYRKVETWALQVLVKGRWWAQKSLFGNNIWIAFPDGGKTSPLHWYMVPHDLLVAHGKKKHSHTDAWKQGLFHKPFLSKDLVEAYESYQIEILANRGPDYIKLLLLQNAKEWA